MRQRRVKRVTHGVVSRVASRVTLAARESLRVRNRGGSSVSVCATDVTVSIHQYTVGVVLCT